MGFASGTVGFRRYYMTGRHPVELTDEWFAAMTAHAFGQQRKETSDGVEIGWIVPEHLFDVDFSSLHRVAVGRFVYLAMRVDRTAPPSAIVKSYEKMEQAALRKENDGEVLRPEDLRQAREIARSRAEKEARRGAFRRIRAIPVLLDLREGVVYAGNSGLSKSDQLMTLFSETFGVTLVEATAEENACRWAQRQGAMRAFDEALPAFFVDPPIGQQPDSSPAFPGNDRAFLGREFLTWLWFRTEKGEAMFELGRFGSATVVIERIMYLRCGFDLTGSDTIRNDAPATTPEARAAVCIGKQPTRLGLLIDTAGEAWSFTFEGPSASVSSLTILRPEGAQDAAAWLEYRFGKIRETAMLLDELYDAFLTIRLQDAWSKEQDAMCRWAGPTAKPGLPCVKRASA